MRTHRLAAYARCEPHKSDVLPQAFLVEWWPQPALPMPRGQEAIALMRLVVQAQTSAAQVAVHDAFWSLPEVSVVVARSVGVTTRELQWCSHGQIFMIADGHTIVAG